jgi:1-phosphatidylinositol-5-phosphate 4-kinase
LKDNDFIKQGIKVKIGTEKKEKLIEILNSDVDVRDVVRFLRQILKLFYFA